MSSDNPKLRPCPDCEKMVSRRAAVCPNCGCPLAEIEQEARKQEAKKKDNLGPHYLRPEKKFREVKVWLRFITAAVWVFLFFLVAQQSEGSRSWFGFVACGATISALIGMAIGSFRNATEIGALYGLLLGPLGLLFLFGVDGRLECPNCDERINGRPRRCRFCKAEFVWPGRGRRG
jgi:hypothetical protein